VLALPDPSQARVWLTVERHNLLACVRAMSPTADAAELSTLPATHLHDFGFWSDARDLYRQALTACRHLGNQAGEVDGLWGLSEVEWLVGEYGQARECCAQALALARQLGYRRGEAEALRSLGQVAWLVGDRGQAREYFTQALVLGREVGYRFGEVLALCGWGQIDQVGRAREYHSSALALARQLGYRFGEVLALCGLGEVEQVAGEAEHARRYYTGPLPGNSVTGAEADALCVLGHLTEPAERDQADSLRRDALKIYEELGIPVTKTVRAVSASSTVDPSDSQPIV
jgi:tetratricopeptide (TPR) repeat protein